MQNYYSYMREEFSSVQSCWSLRSWRRFRCREAQRSRHWPKLPAKPSFAVLVDGTASKPAAFENRRDAAPSRTKRSLGRHGTFGIPPRKHPAIGEVFLSW